MEAKSANKAPSDNKLLSALCRKSLIWVPIMRTKFWLHWVLVYKLSLFFRNKKMQFSQIQFSNKVTRMSNACWTCCFDNNSSSKFISKLFHTNQLVLFEFYEIFMSEFYIYVKICKLKHSKLTRTWLQIGPNRLRIGLRISVLDNHSNFTIKFTATYCNSAKHISYFLIRPNGMCTFCSLSGIFRANKIHNL